MGRMLKTPRPIICLEEAQSNWDTWKGRCTTCWAACGFLVTLRVSSLWELSPILGGLWRCSCLWVIPAAIHNPTSMALQSVPIKLTDSHRWTSGGTRTLLYRGFPIWGEWMSAPISPGVQSYNIPFHVDVQLSSSVALGKLHVLQSST